MSKLRFGIVGAAHVHIDSYLPLLLQNEEITLLGLYEEEAVLTRKYSSEYGIKTYRSLEQLLDQKLDAVLVCSKNSEHRKHVEQAAKAHVHVLCEKPLATNSEDARYMVDICKENNVLLMPALPMRHSDLVQNTCNTLHAESFGSICGGSCTNRGQMPFDDHHSWFIDPKEAGGGAIMDHTIHVVDILRWFTKKDVLSVAAFSNRIMQAAPTELETAALVLLYFQDGIRFSLDTSWSRPQKFPTWGGLTMRIVCSESVVELDAFGERSTLYGDNEQHCKYEPWGPDANAPMISDFISCVKNKTVNSLRAQDALAAQHVISAIYRSLQTGKVAQVNTQH